MTADENCIPINTDVTNTANEERGTGNRDGSLGTSVQRQPA